MNDNQDKYLPPSGFLRDLLRNDLPLSGNAVADWRAAKLISLTRDQHYANRDWALFLLQSSELNTPKARSALVAGLNDIYHEASLEALIGVAIRDKAIALPRIKMLLEGEIIDSMALEAAAIVADPSLLPTLEYIADQLGAEEDDMFDNALREALACCASGVPPEWRMLD